MTQSLFEGVINLLSVAFPKNKKSPSTLERSDQIFFRDSFLENFPETKESLSPALRADLGLPDLPKKEESEYSACQRLARQSGAGKKLPPVTPSEGYTKIEWEQVLIEADQNFFCFYVGMTGLERDFLFAREWIRQSRDFTRLNGRVNFYEGIVNNPSPALLRGKYWSSWRRSRIVADSCGARYDQWIEAVFEYYGKHLVFRKDTAPDACEPDPRHILIGPGHFAGPKARAAYDTYYDEHVRISRIGVWEIKAFNPVFLAENYKNTPLQKEFFARMLQEIEQEAYVSGRSVKDAINSYVSNKTLPQDVAEDPLLNTICPGYKYKKRHRGGIL